MRSIKETTKRKDKPTARGLARASAKAVAKPARPRTSNSQTSLRELVNQIDAVPVSVRLERARENAKKLIGREML